MDDGDAFSFMNSIAESHNSPELYTGYDTDDSSSGFQPKLLPRLSTIYSDIESSDEGESPSFNIDFELAKRNIERVSKLLDSSKPETSDNSPRRATKNLKRKFSPCLPGQKPRNITSLSEIKKRLSKQRKSLGDLNTETSADKCAYESEYEQLSEEEPEETRSKKSKTAAKCQWTEQEPPKNLKKRRSVDILKERPGPVGQARYVNTATESLSLFLDKDIKEMVIGRLNDQISRQNSGNKDLARRESPVDTDEFDAFLSLFYFRGLHHDTTNPTDELWSDKGAQRPFYRAVMDQCRFKFILKCLTFHDPVSLRINYTDDMFAKMRELLNMFEANLRKWFKHSELVCLDETLRNHFSQTNCDFLIFMPDKPGQMGLFFYTMADTKVRYALTCKLRWYALKKLFMPILGGGVQNCTTLSIFSFTHRKYFSKVSIICNT